MKNKEVKDALKGVFEVIKGLFDVVGRIMAMILGAFVGLLEFVDKKKF